jgi:hypothetical protein
MHAGTAHGAARWRFVKAGDLQDSIPFERFEVRSSTHGERLGTLEGFIVDGDSGRLHYVVVDSGGWFSGGSYLIPPAYTQADGERNVLWAETTREAMSRFPEFDAERYPALSDEQVWGIERRIIEAYGDDPGVVAPSPDWDRRAWAHYRQPEWWRGDYDRAYGHTPGDDVPVAAAPAPAETLPSDESDAPTVRTQSGRWPDPAVERAQPGDVLGIERGGETTSLGDTREDEDRRRETAEEEYREISTDDEDVRPRSR